ncbi:uncharacterized protein T551_01751 [Pneumocystis jirovecii RU7]|uniref:Nuclear segregation protein Bfr1 n=1 Tax=Pneumocystis jirovecii (strain RU7) TaxID=1408657 RepID=A0A0W4ZQ15_PNEJ7|nr:uncharacterized protein T551_01751 [Pneumocystis jirovecii RU7]KTW30468.1 hypothetical protein T551_01751 [Pneumocystis jirovecii RU7]
MQEETKVSRRPTRPDEAAFKLALAQVDAELQSLTKKIDDLRTRTEQSHERGGAHERSQRIRHEMYEIRVQQAQFKQSKQKTMDQVKQLEEAMKTKISEMQLTKKRLPFKTIDELDQRILELERAVDSGVLKLVDEKKCLSEISTMKRLRKSFSNLVYQQSAIDSDKKRLSEIKKHLEDPVSKALSEQYDKLKTEQIVLRQEQENVYKFQKSLYEERNKLNQKRIEAYEKKKNLQDNYYSDLRKFNKFEKEEKQKQWERRRQQQEEYNKEKRKQLANKMLEEASQPAFIEEIITCENLIRFLDPSAGLLETQIHENVNLPELNVRTVVETDMDTATVLKSKAERDDYFIHGIEKKNKANKRNKRTLMPADDNAVTNFNIDMHILQQFSFVNVNPPLKHSQISSCIEDLKERVKWYKDNQEKTVAERVEKAKKEIEELEVKALQQSQEKKQNYEKKLAQEKVNGVPKKTLDS